MKNNLLILSLFLMVPFTMEPAQAASVERDNATRQEISTSSHQARTGLIQRGKYYIELARSWAEQNPRKVSFVAKSIGSAVSLLSTVYAAGMIDGVYPNSVTEFIIDYVGNNYVVGGTICLIGAYQLYQAAFGKLDNRPIMTQVMDATGVPSLTEMVWNTIKSDPKKGSTLIARDLGVSEKEVRKTLRENGWDNEANRKAAASGRSKTPSRARR